MLEKRRPLARSTPGPRQAQVAAAPLRAELVGLCAELAAFLRGFGEKTWAAWLDACASKIGGNREGGLDDLLEGFAGIAGICDLYLCPEAGHCLDAADEATINERLLTLIGSVHAAARRLQDA